MTHDHDIESLQRQIAELRAIIERLAMALCAEPTLRIDYQDVMREP
jgi:hypothetical protein